MLQARKRPDDTILSAERRDGMLEMRTGRGLLRVEPKRGNVFRIRYTQEEGFADRTGDGILADGAFDGWRLEETDGEIRVVTEEASLFISRENGSIRYLDAYGTLLLAEAGRALERFEAPDPAGADAEAGWEEIDTPDGKKRVPKKQAHAARSLYRTWLHLAFREGERLYGLGQTEEGLLDRRGTAQYLHQANRKIAVPLLVSSLGWGILFATDGTAIFQDTQYGSYFHTAADPEQDYYFIAGGNLDGVIAGYRYLTGKAALPPRWAMGYFQSQERYETQEELLSVAEGYRQRHIGLDCIVLDWNSWRPGEWGQKTFDPDHFGDMTGTISRLHGLGVRFMLSIWPNMAENCEDYRAFRDKGMLLPESDIYDAFDPEARALYWEQTERSLFCHGIDAWWCDSCEPFTPEWTHLEKPDPSEMYREYTETAARHIPLERANAYSLHHARTIYEGQRASGSSKRVLNLMRSAHTGQQRYGAVLWSGDTEAAWESLRRQIPAGLNFCASGFPYWTMDIGAFFVRNGWQWFWKGQYDRGMDDPRYRELFVRWHQFGAFLPVFRGHGTDIRRELWMLDGEDHRFYEAAVEANRLRYRLIPYLYSLAGNAWLRDGTPMRMLAFDFPKDEKALDVSDQYMLGPALMVCPVTRPLYFDERGEAVQRPDTSREVYLPAGTDWYDWYTGKRYEGGRIVRADARLDRIPLFVRAGSVIPVCEGLESAADLTSDRIGLLVFPGRDGAFELYEDAGDGYGYEDGQYAVTEIRWDDAARKLHILRPYVCAEWFASKWEPKVRIIG